MVHGWEPMRALFLVRAWIFWLCLPKVGGSSLGSIYKDTKRIHGAPPLVTEAPAKGLTSWYHHTGLRMSTYGFWKDIHSQAMTPGFCSSQRADHRSFWLPLLHRWCPRYLSLSDLLHSLWWSLGPCCCQRHNSAPFYDWVIFCSIYVPCLPASICLLMNIYLGDSHVLATENSAARNTEVHASFQVSALSGYMPRSAAMNF